MPDTKTILGQVPPQVRESGTPRQKLDAIWRALGFSRAGLQTRVAGDVAEAWERQGRHGAPRLPVADPRQAAKRLDRALSGDIPLPLDLAFELIACLPDGYREAAEALLLPRPGKRNGDSFAQLLQDNQQSDSTTDTLRFGLAATGTDSLTADELIAQAQAFERELATCKRLASHLRGLAFYRQQGGKA